MTTFWTGLGGKLAERLLALVLTPAFAFWAGGVVAWAYANGGSEGWKEIGEWLTRRSGPEQAALGIGGLLLIAVSGIVVERLSLSVLRLLEGYWPAWAEPLRRLFVAWHARGADRDRRQRGQLAARVDAGEATDAERRRYISLDRRLRRVPTEPTAGGRRRLMPTRLGNILMAGESWPVDKYGLDPVKCWPRLWLVLPDTVKAELTGARAALNGAAAVWVWSTLFVIWAVWAWWAIPAGVVVASIAYGLMGRSAAVYSDLFEATFDVHRRELYDALDWPRPRTPADEKELGQAITEFLWRGSDDPHPTYATAESAAPGP